MRFTFLPTPPFMFHSSFVIVQHLLRKIVCMYEASASLNVMGQQSAPFTHLHYIITTILSSYTKTATDPARAS